MKSFKLDNETKISSGFKAPESYFESFTERMMQLVPEEEKVKVVPIYRRSYSWIAAVAALLVIALGITFYFKQANKNTLPDDAAIESYLVYQANISTYDIIQNLDEKDIKELEQSVAISDEAIEDYMYNHNIINE